MEIIHEIKIMVKILLLVSVFGLILLIMSYGILFPFLIFVHGQGTMIDGLNKELAFLLWIPCIILDIILISLRVRESVTL